MSEADPEPDIDRDEKKTICQSCDREWEGAGCKEIAETHAARYDHEVVYLRRVVIEGTRKEDNHE